MIDFIIIGLPRSGTTWLSNFFTTDRSLCLHDPFAWGAPETWPRDARRFGISCTGAFLFPRWLAQQCCPVAIIERDTEACDASLRRLGMGSAQDLHAAIGNAEGRRFQFDALWQEETARELWDFLLPGLAFDAIRFRMLKEIQVQPHMGKWRAAEGVFEEMTRREAGG